MDVEMIKEIIAAFKEAELTKLSLKYDEFELKLGKEINMIQTVNQMVKAPVQMTAAVISNEENQVVSADKEDMLPKESKKLIKSPMVGTFYSASSPGEVPFVTVGTKVKKGDVVCVVEAMKLMNEVEAEEDGEIAEILVDNEEMVEYGQALFVLK